MFGNKQRCWYVARHKKTGHIEFVLNAKSMKKAETSLGVFAERYRFENANWLQLRNLFRCEKPVAAIDTDSAAGDLTLQIDKYRITVRIAD